MNAFAPTSTREDPAQVRAQLLDAIRLSPDDGELPLDLGNVEMELENFSGALSAFAVAAGLLPREARVHSGQALAFQKLGRSSDAAHSAVLAVSLDPNDARALKVLARIHLYAWQHEAAEETCHRVLQLNADDADARQLLEEALVQEAKLAENLLDVRPGAIRRNLPPKTTSRQPREHALK